MTLSHVSGSTVFLYFGLTDQELDQEILELRLQIAAGVESGSVFFTGEKQVKHIEAIKKVKEIRSKGVQLTSQELTLTRELIKQANDVCPDIPEDEPLVSLADALTVLIHEALPHDSEISTDEIYDLLEKYGM